MGMVTEPLNAVLSCVPVLASTSGPPSLRLPLNRLAKFVLLNGGNTSAPHAGVAQVVAGPNVLPRLYWTRITESDAFLNNRSGRPSPFRSASSRVVRDEVVFVEYDALATVISTL